MAAKITDDFFKTKCPHCLRTLLVDGADLKDGFVCVHCGGAVSGGGVIPGTVLDEAPEPTEKKEGEGKSPALACDGCGAAIKPEHPRKALRQCRVCGKLSANPGSLSLPADKEAEPPPLPAQLARLRQMGVATIPEHRCQAAAIIEIVKQVAEKPLRQEFPSYQFLPLRMKEMIVNACATADWFGDLYFNGVGPQPPQLRRLVAAAARDEELIAAAAGAIAEDRFRMAMNYVVEFAKYVWNLDLEADAARIATMKAFHRGFGEKLLPHSSTLYDPHGGKVEFQAKVGADKLALYYRRQGERRTQIEKLLGELGFEPKDQPLVVGGGRGCLLLLALSALPIIAAVFASKKFFSGLY